MYGYKQKTDEKKDLAAVELGRRGGLKGGPARAKKLIPKQRGESARKAAQARWNKAKANKKNGGTQRLENNDAE